MATFVTGPHPLGCTTAHKESRFKSFRPPYAPSLPILPPVSRQHILLTMKNEIEACLIKYIADEWRSLRSDEWATRRDYSSRTREATLDTYWNPLPEEHWPWGVWIRQHD